MSAVGSIVPIVRELSEGNLHFDGHTISIDIVVRGYVRSEVNLVCRLAAEAVLRDAIAKSRDL